MEIIDKTNENWQVGDKVQTDDGRAGIINNTADGKCAIVRTDSEHFGSFSYGLVYDVNPSIEKLQLDNPAFYKVNKNNTNEDWQPGTFVKNNEGKIGVIVRDYDGNYVIANAKSDTSFDHSLDLHYSISSSEYTMSNLKASNSKFHKVPSKVILGEE